MNRIFCSAVLLAAASVLATNCTALAHGFAGSRFFPATIATEDPFVADELSLPTVSTINTDEGQETDVSVELAKRITPNFGIGIGETWQNFSSGPSGFGNLEVSGKYLLLNNGPHEFLLSLGADAEVGGTGAKRVGADSFSTITPGIFFGKGMGDLPNSSFLKWLRPIALTGSVGIGIPTETSTVDDMGEMERNPNTLETGLAIEYSFPYLQSAVQDIGLGAPFNKLIPLVEFSFVTPLNRGQGGQMIGTINPGLLWLGQSFQLGAEAIIPVNSRTGDNVGAVFQLHLFLDDIFPNSIGKPIFGR